MTYIIKFLKHIYAFFNKNGLYNHYDWVFILLLERYKLCNMLQLKEMSEINGIHIKRCIKLIDIIIDTDRYGLDSKVNWKNSSIYKYKVKLGISSDVILEDLGSIRMHKALCLYNRIRNEQLFNWWV